MARTQIKTPGIADGSVTTAKLDSSIVGALVPIGGIIMWSGSIANIPTGWRLCNGANGTPNLQNRFIVGAGSGYAVGNTGGSANATLVSHSHTGTTDTEGEHSHTALNGTYLRLGTQPLGSLGKLESSSNLRHISDNVPTNIAGEHNHTFGTSTAGSSATNANLPPYYALAYIMRIS